MTTTPVDDPAPGTSARPHHLYSVRWKMLLAFAGVFTIVFVVICVWVLMFTRTTTQNRLIEELELSASGGVAGMDAERFSTLTTTVPAVPDPTKETGFGYPDSELYRGVAQELLWLRKIVANAGVYSYFRDPADGRLYFAASAGYLLDPQIGVQYRVPVDQIVDAATYRYMEQGLVQATNQPEYVDDFGKWISAYAPIKAADGTVVGAVGIDYPLTYVDTVQTRLRNQLIPVLLISYGLLLAMVLALATSLTRPLNRLTSATKRVAEGEYDLDVRAIVPTRFPDEIWVLAESFATMTTKVAERERSLTQEVQRLTIEIDHARRAEAVREITETDFFADLAAKAAEMRRRVSEDPEPA